MRSFFRALFSLLPAWQTRKSVEPEVYVFESNEAEHQVRGTGHAKLSVLRAVGEWDCIRGPGTLLKARVHCELRFSDEPGRFSFFTVDSDRGGLKYELVKYGKSPLYFIAVEGDRKLNWGQNAGSASACHLFTGWPEPGWRPPRMWRTRRQRAVFLAFQGKRDQNNAVYLIGIPPDAAWSDVISCTSGRVRLDVRLSKATADMLEWKVAMGDAPESDEWESASRLAASVSCPLSHNLG